MLDHSYLLSVLSYSRRTGQFKWRVSRKSRGGMKEPGDIAGYVGSRGYVRLVLDGVEYPAHRLAWFYVNGSWPDADIDHRNGNRSDNRWCNLRLARGSFNQENRRVASASCKSGLLGAWPASDRSKGWRSAIKVGSRVKFLGYFDTAEAAHAAYVKAKRELHQGCTI